MATESVYIYNDPSSLLMISHDGLCQQIPTNTNKYINYNQIPQNTYKFHRWGGGIWEIGGRDVRGYRARRAVTAHISGENIKKTKRM